MAEFKLCIADPKSGKTYQKEAKDSEAALFIGKNIGEPIKGETIGITGYELLITGGSDKCGFPMRKGIKGIRKKLTLLGGVGLRESLSKGTKKKKTVCGHKINQNISQINLKITKEGTKKLDAIFGKEEEKTDASKSEPKTEEKKEVSKEKQEKAKPEVPKAESKKEEKKE